MTAPRSDSTTWDEALAHIAAEECVWVRVAAIHANGEWHERLLELTSGAQPPSWKQLEWKYPSVFLGAETRSGKDVVEWLSGERMSMGDRSIALPPHFDSVQWERVQSRSPRQYEQVEWPSAETSMISGFTGQPEPSGMLISDTAPSFVSFYATVACFFYFNRQPRGGQVNQGVVYRHQDTRGRVNAVRILTDKGALEIEVEGDSLCDMVVELAGDVPGPTKRLGNGNKETVTFALDEDLPPGAWVLLRHGSEWIDRRFLAVPYQRGLDHGVEYVVEPGTELEVFLANREGPQVEYKEVLPRDDQSKHNVMKTVCAFANGSGGTLLFGVTDERGVVGVEIAGLASEIDRLRDILDDWVEPMPIVTFKELPIEGAAGRVVLGLVVEPSMSLHESGKPSEGRFPYVRHHAKSVRARAQEMEAIVRARTPQNQTMLRDLL